MRVWIYLLISRLWAIVRAQPYHNSVPWRGPCLYRSYMYILVPSELWIEATPFRSGVSLGTWVDGEMQQKYNSHNQCNSAWAANNFCAATRNIMILLISPLSL